MLCIKACEKRSAGLVVPQGEDPMLYQRVVVPRYGDPDVLQVVEDDIPEPEAGQVRVRILAAGVAWGDILRRRGVSAPSLPFTPGYDLVGVIDRVGEGAVHFKEGQMVAALPITGGYAEYICLPETELVQLPDGVDPAEAVCLVLNYVTAFQILHRAAQVQKGELILVHAAAGGVGTALLQLARLDGLETYGTASLPKHDLVKSLGAMPIDYRGEDFVQRLLSLEEGGVNVVCDPLGGMSLLKSYRALRGRGRLISYGVQTIFSEGAVKTIGGIILASLLNIVPDRRTVRFYNITRSKYSTLEMCRKDLSRLVDYWKQGEIKPILAGRIPLVEAARAHQLLEAREVTGKIVLIPGD
jgi:NADPH:quinone reductase-like Zn-dependent oxidoreductase